MNATVSTHFSVGRTPEKNRQNGSHDGQGRRQNLNGWYLLEPRYPRSEPEVMGTQQSGSKKEHARSQYKHTAVSLFRKRPARTAYPVPGFQSYPPQKYKMPRRAYQFPNAASSARKAPTPHDRDIILGIPERAPIQ